jgi:uncharacterized protein (DUF1697 family)
MGLEWAALLRGVNVGGHNRLPMADLRAALTAAGLIDVRTYIQSGNVVFDTDPASTPDGRTWDDSTLASLISAAITSSSSLTVPVVVRPVAELARIGRQHPEAGGDVPEKWLHVFLLDGVTHGGDQLDTERFRPDRIALADREVYATYPEGSGRSKLTIEVVERAFGVTATARNLTTIGRLVALASEER